MPIYQPLTQYKYHFKDICNIKVTDTTITQQAYTPRNIYQRDLRRYLKLQEELGFEAAWFITFHYLHPSERMTPYKEREADISKGITDKVGFRTNDGRSLWAPSGSDNTLIKNRNDLDFVSKDSRHVINVLLKELYGISRPQTHRDLPSILAFHEFGGEQYHTHLMVPKPRKLFCHDATYLRSLLNVKVRRKCKSLSAWKDIDVREVDYQYGLMGYLNKQTKPEHTSLDLMSSLVHDPHTRRVTAATY